ncbi:hypothetical protein DL89DRAFT_318252 [Linderina pennispora]|uniref:Uncharacterized protein n=1 Tax=Linderina pennispora TaxID=61395 RepID=A0A1Y1W576_9FUNG|nr:uncharacterized protein DL89DRAFT_318252 [Linderina pennispora]ORX68505.1 hypothetical protein DL89DRAFT_318252 [Linderina pennispora]
MTDPKFVDEDAIDYVQVHTGFLNKKPIAMEEINEFVAGIGLNKILLILECGSVIFGCMCEVSWPMRFLDKISWLRVHTFCAGHLESEFLLPVQILVDLLAHPQCNQAIFDKHRAQAYLHASLLVPLGTDSHAF